LHFFTRQNFPIKTTPYANQRKSSMPETPIPSCDEPHNNAESVRNTSDDALALTFTDLNHKDMRFSGQLTKWHIWTGIKWESDHKLTVYKKARLFIRQTAVGIQDAIVKRLKDEIPFRADDATKQKLTLEAQSKARRSTSAIQSSGTIHSIVKLARYDKRIAIGIEEWDADPWALNTPAGTIDLKTGEVRKHNPLNYITQATAVGPRNAQPVKWLEFLKMIMRNDEEMIRYLQKVFGYCLVGETKEHQMYFAYGTGANGKGVTLSTIRGVLGSYGIEAAIETFIINDSSRHPTELADLKGSRLVTCGETDDGQRWAEARIKMLTGGDPVKARFMRQDPFEYTPQFKLFLAGNHKPRLNNVDEAIERRFRLIPFTFTVPKPQRDVDLGQKLREEWPAILAWAIDGCLAWQAEGLEPPAAVATATKSYLNQEDSITAWFNECCAASDSKSFVYIKDLFESWRGWALDNGEQVGTKRILTRHLEDREPVLKISKAKRNEGFGFMGLELTVKAKSLNA
jgi:putative DNA primase/helicase